MTEIYGFLCNNSRIWAQIKIQILFYHIRWMGMSMALSKSFAYSPGQKPCIIWYWSSWINNSVCIKGHDTNRSICGLCTNGAEELPKGLQQQYIVYCYSQIISDCFCWIGMKFKTRRCFARLSGEICKETGNVKKRLSIEQVFWKGN